MYSLGFFKPVCILPKRPKVPILASCVPRLTEMGKGHLRGSRRSKQARLVERRYGYPGPRPQWNTLPFAMRRSILRRREREAQARRRAGRAGRAGRARAAYEPLCCFFCVFLRLSALVLQPGSRGLAVGWLLRLVENFGLIAEI